MPRPKGAKNKHSKLNKQSSKVYPVRLYLDLQDYVDSKENKNEYFNMLVRKDMNEQININEMEESDMGRMNTYNFAEKGCVFYHVIAESEEQCYSLAEGAGIDVTGMELELERMNVCDELGRPYKPRIEEALVH